MKSTFKSFLVAVAMVAVLSLPALAQGFGKVQGGPLYGTNAGGPVNPVLGVDTLNNTLWLCDGPCTPQDVTLSIQGPQTALTNVTTAQTMFSFALNPGLQNAVGATLRVCGEAMFSNGVTTPAITVSVKIGSSVTPVSVVTANNANSNTNAPLNFCFLVTTTTAGASGADEAHGWLTDATAAAWASGTAVSTYVDGNTAASSTYDHTVANTLAVQIASTAVLTSVTPRHLVIEKLF